MLGEQTIEFKGKIMCQRVIDIEDPVHPYISF